MRLFSFIFATLLLLGTVLSVQSEQVTGSASYSVTISQDTAALTDTVDTITANLIPNDIGLLSLWVRADTVLGRRYTDGTGMARDTLMDSIHIFWKILGKGNYWRPLYVDSTQTSVWVATNGVAPAYISTGGTGIRLKHGVAKYAIFYDPTNPAPIPIIGEGEYLQFLISRTQRTRPLWSTTITLSLRWEKVIR